RRDRADPGRPRSDPEEGASLEDRHLGQRDERLALRPDAPRPEPRDPRGRRRPLGPPPLRSPAMRSDIVPGARFPDYELPDHTKTPRRLSELQGEDPLILTLARGHYCPKEHQQHLQLAAFSPQIAVAYTQIATISTDDHHASQEFRASV